MYYAQYDNGNGFDLCSFTTKADRDEFVSQRPSSAMAITHKEAKTVRQGWVQFRDEKKDL